MVGVGRSNTAAAAAHTAVGTVRAVVLVLFVLLRGYTLFLTTLELSFPAKTGDPFAIDMDKVPKELWIPTPELTDNGSLLNGLLSLGERLIGDFRAVFLHDANHVPVKVNISNKFEVRTIYQ
jgi:hypothetical protein